MTAHKVPRCQLLKLSRLPKVLMRSHCPARMHMNKSESGGTTFVKDKTICGLPLFSQSQRDGSTWEASWNVIDNQNH